MLVLGIETSCDETAAAIVRDGKEILSNVIYSEVKTHTPYGGVVPELASREHLLKIRPIVDQAFTDAGVTLDDMRMLYQGSAGGASFDISWALDETEQPVFLSEISFVRIEVLSGKAEVDALAAVARNVRARGRR